MSRRCQITGRGPRVGNKISHAHNVSKRRWNINLQKVRVIIDGQVKRIRVSTKAIKSGMITRPPFTIKEPKAKRLRPQEVKAATVVSEDEPVTQFFSSASMVDRVFRKKPKPAESTDTQDVAAESEVVEEVKTDSDIPVLAIPTEEDGKESTTDEEPPA